MNDKVIDLDRKPYAPPVSDFWFGQVEHRLNKIETMVRRLEWQIWILFSGACAMLVMEIIVVLKV